MENNKRESRQSAVSAGKRLKDAREKKSLTIEQVQKQTKIHSTVLIGLEEGRPSDTLTDTYVRSFLKKYAQFLDINSVELLRDYFPARIESPAPNTPIPESVLSKETQAPPKFLYMTGLAVAAIISLMLFIFIAGKVTTAFKKIAPAQKKNSTAVTAKKKAVGKSAKTVQKKKAAVNARSETKELVPKTTPLILEIKVKESVLVTLRKDGILFFDRVLPAGLVEKTVANNSIELDVAKAGSLELVLNGRPIVLQDKNGLIALEITRKGIRVK
ncbi:MAG: helix-turn-helix domain-containing protein [Candidatus Omnitrophota bacterium]|nr:helix-turn-helix domain-containing protein [Candidatus Omnitrophota bacterium]